MTTITFHESKSRVDLQSQINQHLESSPPPISEIIEYLRSQTDEGSLINPLLEQEAFETWGQTYLKLAKKNLFHQAAEVSIAWYDRITELQLKNSRRYHKGGAAHNTGVSFSWIGDQARAVWFMACAFVEDTMGSPGDDIPSTPATAILKTHFKWTTADFSSLASFARADKGNTDGRSWFPEMTVVNVARTGSLRIPWSNRGDDIPINRPLLKFLIDRLPKGSTDDKKNSLEFLASYLAVTLPGVRIKPNVQTSKHGMTYEHEIDLVAIQHGPATTYLLEAIGRHFLIECKNWDHPIGARELNHFVAKMKFHRCHCGVIFSNKGITGDANQEDGLQNARITQLRWYQMDNCVVLVISKNHLDELCSSSYSFSDVLLREYESVRFSNLEQ